MPTPIGNLGDITLRALETLKSVKMIAAEDTRSTGKLLQHYGIQAPRLLSYHKFSEKKRSSEILRVLQAGEDVAIVSDAGSPGISDPSELIVKQAIEHGITITALPGATALIPAITASGLPSASFLFLGFLPTKQSERRALIQSLKQSNQTTIIYESPHHIYKTLQELHEVLGSREVVIARELTKFYEEYIRGSLTDLLEDYSITEKGEFVLLLGPAEVCEASDLESLRSRICELHQAGEKSSEILRILASEFPRNTIYEQLLQLKQNGFKTDN